MLDLAPLRLNLLEGLALLLAGVLNASLRAGVYPFVDYVTPAMADSSDVTVLDALMFCEKFTRRSFLMHLRLGCAL